MLPRSVVAWTLLLGLVGCAAPASPTAASPSAPAQPTEIPSSWSKSVVGKRACEGRVVLYTVSQVLRTFEGASVRLVALYEVGHPGSRYLGFEGVQYSPVETDGATGYSTEDRHLMMHPRDGLTWGDVESEADLVIETEVQGAAIP